MINDYLYSIDCPHPHFPHELNSHLNYSGSKVFYLQLVSKATLSTFHSFAFLFCLHCMHSAATNALKAVISSNLALLYFKQVLCECTSKHLLHDMVKIGIMLPYKTYIHYGLIENIYTTAKKKEVSLYCTYSLVNLVWKQKKVAN